MICQWESEKNFDIFPPLADTFQLEEAHSPLTSLNGKESDGQWTGQWTVDSGQWTVDNGQWIVDSG